jgi:hypothetical protein
MQGDCPEQDSVKRLLRGQLPDELALGVERHVEQCAACSQSLSLLLSEDSLLQELRSYASGKKADCAVDGLIERLKNLPAAAERLAPATLSSSTPETSPSHMPTFSHSKATGTATLQDIEKMLAPAQNSEEIGRLGPYRVLKVLGAGGMGVVFQAEDPQLRRAVALKVMHPVMTHSASACERFLREARAMAALEHDHIVPVYQVGEDCGVLFLAMPLLKGETLEERLQRERKLPSIEVVRIARETAAGLAAAHECRLIHRDVKPSNLWLEGKTGRVKLLDFGLAQPADESGHLTGSGMILGTPQYMAPEQACGIPADARSDLFSLGSVLYRMTTGELPFKGANAMQLVRSLELDQPKPPRELAPEVPAELSELIMQLLAKDPARRIPSACILIEKLDGLDLGTPAPALPGESDKRVSQGEAATVRLGPETKAGPQRRWLILAATVGSVGLLVLLGFIFKSALNRSADEPPERTAIQQPPREIAPAKKPQPEVPVEERVFHGHTGVVGPVASDGLQAITGSWDGTMRLWNLKTGTEVHSFEGHLGWVWSLALSPDGRQALSAGGSVDKTVRLWDLEQRKLLKRMRGPGAERFLGVAFAPQGLWAVSDGGGDDHTLRLWDVDKGMEIRRFAGHTDRVWRVAFTPDGTRLASGGQDRTIRLWDTATGGLVREFEGHTALVTAVALAPDGSRILSASEDDAVRLWEVDTGKELRQFKGHKGKVEALAFSPDGVRALTGGDDRCLGLWDVETGEELGQADGHTDLIGGVAFTPDGTYALSTSADKTMRLWRLPRLPK